MKNILESSAWSLNEEMLETDDLEEGGALKDGDVVAVIPPVSGG